jgi:NAD-dependent DNA ligase
MKGITFCLTGTFRSGLPEEITQSLATVSCQVRQEVSREVDYLLIGDETLGFTPEMEEALSLLHDGHLIRVVHENEWLGILDRGLRGGAVDKLQAELKRL